MHLPTSQACAAELERSALSEPYTLAHLRALDELPDYHDYGERFHEMPRDVHVLLCGPQPCPFTTKIPAGADGVFPDHTLTVRTLTVRTLSP